MDLPDRYEALGVLGRGGMGTVLRVRDRVLGRVVAMKVCRDDLSPSARARFQTEARVTSQLEHPGIVPVYELGELASGEPFYTMPVIRGRTFAAVLTELAGPVGVRRALGILHDVCEAIGYAHARGTIHRDLKPDNVMVGEHGETLVVDWGLAKVVGAGDDVGDLASPDAEGHETLAGGVVGSPGYMAPEQARGEHVDQRADVHALGCMLREVLAHPAPDLVEIVDRATAPSRDDRFADARELARALRSWLDGEQRRDRALRHMVRAERLHLEVHQRRSEANERDEQADAALRDVPAWADEAHKRPGWRLRDTARALRREADRLETERLQALRDALTQDPDLPDAHAALASHYRIAHERAEQRGDTGLAGQLEVLLRVHDRGEHARYLQGLGAVSLVTDPPGAEVTAWRVEERDRRLVLTTRHSLGPTPLRQVALPAGSWVLRITHPERVDVDYPVRIGRLEHWDGTQAVALPRPNDLGPHDRYVPAGWFVAGGDPGAVFPAPATRHWLPGLIVRAHPVCNREFLAFLDDGAEVQVPPGFARGDDGTWTLVPDTEGDRWDEDWPVVLVSHATATAFAAWEARRTGQPWRLPRELEWEKAARGVDGRIFPWGNEHDPSWCLMRSSHGPKHPSPARPSEYPADCSVYGVRGMGGNVSDLCDGDDPQVHPVRGGAWTFGARTCRCASRMQLQFGRFDDATGFRLVRTWPAAVSSPLESS